MKPWRPCPKNQVWSWAVLLTAVLATEAFAAEREGSPAAIQDALGVDWLVHDVGNVEIMIANLGFAGAMSGTGLPWSDSPSGIWPRGGSVEYLWTMGFWFGALENGEPRVTTTVFDFFESRPGPSELDRMYVTREGAPGGNRLPWPAADDDNDGRLDEDRLDGRDNDGDGLIDEDFAAISDQMLVCEYNDSDPAISVALPEHEPLEILVQQSSLAWSAPFLNDFIAFDLLVTNNGSDTLDELHIGVYADFDIGSRDRGFVAIDDFAGFWEGTTMGRIGGYERPVTVSLCYMFDDDGDQGTAGYVGILYLGQQAPDLEPKIDAPPLWKNFRMTSGYVSFENGGDPSNDAERYQILAGTAPHSLPAPHPETGLRPPQNSRRQDDYRVLGSAPRIPSLQAGQQAGFQMALVFGLTLDELVETAARAKLLYDGTPADCDMDPQTGENGEECIVRWRLPRTVAIEATDLVAHVEAWRVRLRWRLSEQAQQDLIGVHVQRATAARGPYETRTRSPLAIAGSMSFEDVRFEAGSSYWYRLVFLERGGTESMSRSVEISNAGRPATTTLAVPVQLDPERVEFRYGLAASRSDAVLQVYDARGRLVVGLDAGTGAGQHLRTWNRTDTGGNRVRRGVYFVHLQCGSDRLARKFVLLGD